MSARRREFDQPVLAVVAQVQHLPASVSRIDEIEEAVVEHVHLVPRYANDPRPEWPFPFPQEDPPPFPEHEVRADAERLRRAAVEDA